MKRSRTPTIDDVATRLNLGVAHKMARKGKSFYHSVQKVDDDPDKYLNQLQEILLSGEYRTSEYVHETVNDNGKTREISKLPYYPDRIVHWAIMLQMERNFLQKFTSDSHAAIAGRGTHTALRQTRRYLISDPEGTKYCLKLDVRKYFPHIRHEILRDMISEMVRNKPLLDLFFEIIESVPPERGVPIGNYLSQFFANLYLSEFDHWIKEKMGVKYYIRYMDDIVVFGPDAEYLHRLFREIEWHLTSRLRLDIKPNWQVFKVESRGVDFVGYRMYHNRTLVRKKTFARMRKRCATIYYHAKIYGELTRSELSSLMSYNGIVQHCTPKVRIDLYRRYIEPTVLVLGINITKTMRKAYYDE